ncbi:MAG: fatty acid desaturase [Elusimicrobiota bacterium]|nr:MAG: fatty acid desaturase [Elusimicrobiota bacterium]
MWHYGFTWLELANFLVMFVLTSVSITGGYHRLFSHKSYEASTPLKLFYLVFGAAAVENSLLKWASDHRYHHSYVDQPEDPYNILKGGLYAHMGWIFLKDTRDERRFGNVPDLMKDKLVMWQHRYYLPLVILFTFALPTWIGLIQGRPVGGLLWGGFLRVVMVHHTTFFINSLAHLYGTKPYSLKDTARDSWWLAPSRSARATTTSTTSSRPTTATASAGGSSTRRSGSSTCSRGWARPPSSSARRSR